MYTGGSEAEWLPRAPRAQRKAPRQAQSVSAASESSSSVRPKSSNSTSQPGRPALTSALLSSESSSWIQTSRIRGHRRAPKPAASAAPPASPTWFDSSQTVVSSGKQPQPSSSPSSAAPSSPRLQRWTFMTSTELGTEAKMRTQLPVERASHFRTATLRRPCALRILSSTPSTSPSDRPTASTASRGEAGARNEVAQLPRTTSLCASPALTDGAGAASSSSKSSCRSASRVWQRPLSAPSFSCSCECCSSRRTARAKRLSCFRSDAPYQRACVFWPMAARTTRGSRFMSCVA
mmetsp:Transcript_545/g.1690  ORF Transcript_545/g.1690 Transcript_545/m.1690 type:complete len:292 (-) Transcript_545:908-1783(-)